MLFGLAPHVKWFTDPTPYPTQYQLLFSLPVLAAFVLGLAAVGVAWWIQHSIPEPAIVRALERFAPHGPLALGLHLGIALLVAAIFGLLFVPSLKLEASEPLGFGILVVEAMCGLMILLGLATRAAAVMLALLGIVAMQPFTFESILEQVHILGIAIFLFLIGRGPLSLDRIRSVKPPIRDPLVPEAALALVRVMMGFGIFYNALTEKLLNPPLAQSLIARYDFLQQLTTLVPDPLLIWSAGVVEVAIGLVIMSGQFTRPTIAVGAAMFTVTLFFFGWPELLGHLPFYGIMLLLLIAPNADSWGVRRALRPQA